MKNHDLRTLGGWVEKGGGMKRYVWATLPLLAMLAIGFGTANAAQLVSSGNLCVNVQGNNTKNGTPVIAWPCTLGFNEQWEFVNGQFLGLGTANGVSMCLDVKGNGGAGTAVDLYTCNGDADQQWWIGPNGSGEIAQQEVEVLCLDSKGGSGAQLTVEPCNGSASQNWIVQ